MPDSEQKHGTSSAAREAEERRIDRLRDAAPEMFALVESLLCDEHDGFLGGLPRARLVQIRDVYAKAIGGAL